MGVVDAYPQSGGADCIRCLECLETCARKETVTLELGYSRGNGGGS